MKARTDCDLITRHQPGKHAPGVALIFLAGAQTLDYVFYPFMRREMGKGFWGFGSVFACLLVIALACVVRLMYTPLTFWLTAPFAPFVHMLHGPIMMKPQIVNWQLTPYGLWTTLVPFCVFALFFLSRAIPAAVEARRGTKDGKRHSLQAGAPVLQRYRKKTPTQRVQRYYEPLSLILAGYAVSFASPPLGTFIFYAAFPHFAQQFLLWRGLNEAEQRAYDMRNQAEYTDKLYAEAMAELGRQHLRPVQPSNAENAPAEATSAPRSLDDLLKEMQPETRARFLEALRKGRLEP